jgi:hypothetical protein
MKNEKYLADNASANSVFPKAKLIANANERAEGDENMKEAAQGQLFSKHFEN